MVQHIVEQAIVRADPAQKYLPHQVVNSTLKTVAVALSTVIRYVVIGNGVPAVQTTDFAEVMRLIAAWECVVSVFLKYEQEIRTC
jgi:hypothetical protein